MNADIQDDIQFGRSLAQGPRTVMTTMDSGMSNRDRYGEYSVLMVHRVKHPMDMAYKVHQGLKLQNQLREYFRRSRNHDQSGVHRLNLVVK